VKWKGRAYVTLGEPWKAGEDGCNAGEEKETDSCTRRKSAECDRRNLNELPDWEDGVNKGKSKKRLLMTEEQRSGQGEGACL
jgi:hypothetical protein